MIWFGNGGGDFGCGFSVEIDCEMSAIVREQNVMPAAEFEFRTSGSFFISVLHDQGGLRCGVGLASDAESEGVSELDEVAGVVPGVAHHAVPKPEGKAAGFGDGR